MLVEKKIGDKEVLGIARDKRLRDGYIALRNCDGMLQKLVTQAKQEQDHSTNGNVSVEIENLPEGVTSAEMTYLAYLNCVSTALCPSALDEYKVCLQQARDGTRSLKSCKLNQSMLERCLSAETNQMFRASQHEVFRPSNQ